MFTFFIHEKKKKGRRTKTRMVNQVEGKTFKEAYEKAWNKMKELSERNNYYYFLEYGPKARRAFSRKV